MIVANGVGVGLFKFTDNERQHIALVAFLHNRNPVPLEKPSVYGLIILAQEIMSVNWEPYRETVAFPKSTFCLALCLPLAKY